MEHGEQVYLLLGAPGEVPIDPLPSGVWRGWLVTDQGILNPSEAVQSARLSPVAPRAERALVSALQGADVDALNRMATTSGPAQPAAQVLHALRCAAVAPNSSVGHLLDLANTTAFDVADVKLLRRHWPNLGVLLSIAPGVPALVPVSRTSLKLLAVELLTDSGRAAEAEQILDELRPEPVTVLMRAALLLSYARHEQVIELTSTVAGSGDVAALTLIARSVACRSIGDVDTALDSVCLGLTEHAQSGGVITAALEERAHLYSLLGESTAARDDLAALAQFASGATDVTIPIPSIRRRSGDLGPDDNLDRARDRLRRRITAAGRPGFFGGRHHSSYRDEIATMFGHGQVEAVEELLLCLLDAVEDEVDELGAVLDPTFFLTLADLYQDNDRIDDLRALRERYENAEARSGRAAGAVSPASPPTAVPAARPAEPLSAQAVGAVTAQPAAPPVVVAAVSDPATETGAGHTDADRLEPVMGESDDREPALPKRSRSHARDGIAAAAEFGSVAVAVEEPVQPRAAIEAPADNTEPAADDAEPPVREMTAVERTIRGPRVRSL